jgi:hypothetical protein
MAPELKSFSGDQVAVIREIAERWLSDKDEYTRRITARALAWYGDASSYQKLKAALAAEKVPINRQVLREDLSQLEARLQSESAK